MNETKKIFLLTFLTFWILHTISFLTFGEQEIWREIIFLVLSAFAFFIGLKNIKLLTYVIIVELLTGGSGMLFEFNNISIRLALVLILLALYFIFHFKRTTENRQLLGLTFLVTVVFVIGIVNGYFNNHDARLIFKDTVPIFFLFLVYPFKNILTKQRPEQILKIIYWIAMGAVWAAFLATLLTFILYTSNITQIQATFYDWLRQWLALKVTYIGDNYFRITNPSFLLFSILTPFLFIETEKQIDNRFSRQLSVIPLIILPALHLTRGLILGTIISLFAMFFTYSPKKIIKWIIIYALGIFIAFSIIHFISSGTSSFGFYKFIGRGAGILQEGLEQSADTRRLLLNPLTELFIKSPIKGYGFGLTITYFDPFMQSEINTYHLDWGYLEILDEIGIIGLMLISLVLVWMIIIAKDNYAFRPLILSAIAVLASTEVVMQSILHIYGMTTIAILLAILYNKYEKNIYSS